MNCIFNCGGVFRGGFLFVAEVFMEFVTTQLILILNTNGECYVG